MVEDAIYVLLHIPRNLRRRNDPHAGDIERLLSKSMKLAGKEDVEND